MKKLLASVLVFVGLLVLVGCKQSDKVIVVGATPSPHAEILNSTAVKNYVESKGYKLDVKVYQDYVLPNKALNDGGLDANYFQHIPYLNEEVSEKGYDIVAACYVHNEPLNLYGKTKPESYDGLTIAIINDSSNVERAYKLLVALGILDSYSVENFDAKNPVYQSSKNVTIKCIDAGLLNKEVEDGGYAVIPGNYALTAWNTAKATEYRIAGESSDVAYPNIIACKTVDLKSDKINVLVEALAQKEVQDFIAETYGPTVNYQFEDLRK